VAKTSKPGGKLDIAICYADKRWRKIPGLRTRLKHATQSLWHYLPDYVALQAQAALLLTHDEAMQQLNHDFRGHDKPTNILSFPQFGAQDIQQLSVQKPSVFLGDLAMGYQYVAAEAKSEHKILLDHVTHLMIHGILHLLNYTHDTGQDAEQMERLEKTVMQDLGLPDPYAPIKVANPVRRRQRTKVK